MPPLSLPQIYNQMAKAPLANLQRGQEGEISIQQYDDFVGYWVNSFERNCIVCNIRPQRSVTEDRFGARKLLRPIDALPDECAAEGPDVSVEGRCQAIADSVGELLWMFISIFSVLPILDVATPITPEDVSTLNSLKQPWISIYLPTCGAYFVDIQQQKKNGHEYEISIKSELKILGWFSELYIAKFESPESTKLELDTVQEWHAYEDLAEENRLCLPTYLSFRDYFATHKGELVAGYANKDGVWKLIALNGLEHLPRRDAILSLFGITENADSKFGAAIRANVETFRPWFIQMEADADQLSKSAPSEAHTQARITHQKLMNASPSFAITLTHNLVNEPFGAAQAERQTASSFTNMLITVPPQSNERIKCRSDWRHQARAAKAGVSESHTISHSADDRITDELCRVVRIIWDNIDIFKLPISRQLMRDKQNELQIELEKNKQYSEIYASVQKPLNALLNLSRDLTNTAGELSRLRGDHLLALIANRHTLAMLFEDGYIDPMFGHVKVSKHRTDDYTNHNELAKALLAFISIIVGDEFDASPGRIPMVDELKAKLSHLMVEVATRPTLSILAPRAYWSNEPNAAVGAAKKIVEALYREWIKLPFAKYNDAPVGDDFSMSVDALDTLKRRVHSNFKPASIALSGGDRKNKTPTLDDLACIMDENFSIKSFPALSSKNWDEIALFDSATFPFRSVGALFSAILAFFKDKTVKKGTLSYERRNGIRTLVINAECVVTRKGDPTSILESASAEKLAQLLSHFGNSRSDSDSLVFGDFLSPLVALIQTRIERSGQPSIRSEDGAVIVSFHGMNFNWRIEASGMTFTSGG